MTPASLEAALRPQHLAIFGLLHSDPEDDIGTGTLALLGPAEPGFWQHVTATPEFQDRAPDPLDRWSRRVITSIAADAGGVAIFPFGDPPRPFIGWALRSKSCFVSPATLLVHAEFGLFVSFRGAILLPGRLALAAPIPSPCETCAEKPCLGACPADALTKEGYDLPACHGFLDTVGGQSCMSRGCAVRRSCPLARNYHRINAQSAYHMKEFHP